MIDSNRGVGFLQWVAASMLLWAFAGHGQSPEIRRMTRAMNEDNWKKITQMKELEKGYVANLKLNGKSGNVALVTMLAEGFRCGVVTAGEVPLPSPAVIKCVRDMSFLQGACADVTVTHFPKWRKPDADSAGLFGQLDSSPIESSSVLCPYKDTRSPEYLRRQVEAGEELAKNIAPLKLEGQRTDRAFKALLIEGFRCGFDASTEKSDTKASLQMDCTRVPSRIDFCYHARLTIDLKGRSPDFAARRSLQEMQESSIVAVHSSCDLPLIEGQ